MLGSSTLAFGLFLVGCNGGAAPPTPTPDKATSQAGAEAKTTPKAEGDSAAPAKAPEGATQAAANEPAKGADGKAPAGGTKPGAATAGGTEAPAAAATPEAPTAAAPSAAAAAAPEPPAPVVESPKLAEQGFSLWMQSSGRYKAGQQGFVEVVLVPKGEFHCNQEYPYKMKLGAAPAGVTYPTPIVRTEGLSVSPTRATMRVPFVAQNAGEAKVAGKFYFSVCTSEQCVIDNRDVAVTVKVD